MFTFAKDTEYEIDAYRFGNKTRFINHGIDKIPNAEFIEKKVKYQTKVVV